MTSRHFTSPLAGARIRLDRLMCNFTLPLAVTGFFVWGYYFGPSLIHNLIAPELFGYQSGTQREAGLAETAEHLFILGIIFSLCRLSQQELRLRPYIVGAAVFAVWLLLEETDYGYHYLYLLAGMEPWTQFNVHNTSGVNELFNPASKIFFWMLTAGAIFAAVHPHERRGNGWRRFIPDPSLVFAGPLYALVWRYTINIAYTPLTFFGVRSATTGVIHSSPREFAELLAYLLVFLYLRNCEKSASAHGKSEKM